MKRGSLVLGCVILLISGGVYHYGKVQPSALYDYAKTRKKDHRKNGGDVELILEKGERVALAENDSTVTYSKTGEKVKIGASRTISQEKTGGGKMAYNTLIVPYGRRSKIKLSDGTVVWLNSGSKLIYPTVFKEEKREVYLEGEGIFEVAHTKKKPFEVLADNHRIRVLGTVFNVSSYAEDSAVKTVLKSGSVEVVYKGDGMWKGKETVRISPGTMTVYDKGSGKMTSEKVNVEDFFAWKDGVLILESSRMEDIVKKLSRYYNIDILITDKKLAKQTFSGYLDLKESVENVIGTINKTTDFEYFRSEENNKWIIN
ncbi:FecR domain-containing protein [Sinomicrobium kalidii]|uniref:FecR family protein n=1 Tax=Sinomicrobium kalidii TaxID=2900738 RepID=UPI001E42EA74|nr:FecR domain-containing protein [Sinomicrobium kalidii]UGU16665.1 FecR domain-containing protein [Sinomicrobium kalidii]